MNKYFFLIFLSVATSFGFYFFNSTSEYSTLDPFLIQPPEKIYKKIIDMAGPFDGARILDYGCGSGGIVNIVLQEPIRPQYVLAVDSDKEATDDIEYEYEDEIKKGILKSQLVTSPLDLKGQKFDIIFCHNVLEYIDNKEQFIKDLYDLLSNNGVFILSHQDFDSEIYNSSYRNLTRDLVSYFADHGEVGQKQCDGQVARKIPGIFKRAGIDKVTFQTWRIVERTFTHDDYGFIITQMIVKSAHQKFKKEDLEKWLKDLEMKARENDYYFAIDMMIAKAQK